MSKTQKKLTSYTKKRNLTTSSEPKPIIKQSKNKHIFVVQEHHARALHFDFRLEDHGVLISWAVPKGPPKIVGEKRLAIQTEDHPLEYAQFAGIIPKGNYGAGSVKIWDSGTYTNLKQDSISEGLESGEITFTLHGKKLNGNFALVKTKLSDKEPWLFVKMKN
jgi:bifunctional non-homologous end joining protein LigD